MNHAPTITVTTAYWQMVAAHLHLAGAMRDEVKSGMAEDPITIPARLLLLERQAEQHEGRARALLLDMVGAAPSAADYASAVVGVES